MEKIGSILEKEMIRIEKGQGEQEEKKKRDKNLEMVGFSDMSRKGYTLIPNYLLDLKISTTAKVLYALLLSYCWNKNFCFPGQEEVAKRLNINERAIRRNLQELQEAGLIKVTRRGLGKTNKYILYATTRNYKK